MMALGAIITPIDSASISDFSIYNYILIGILLLLLLFDHNGTCHTHDALYITN